MSHSSREPESVAIPSGSGVRHPLGRHFRCLGTSPSSSLETVNARRRAAPINSDLMNPQAGTVRSAGRFRDPRRLHAELKVREAMCPLDDGGPAARHGEKPAWLPLPTENTNA